MERWSGKVAIVTGASVGIGASIVKALVEHGIKVIGCARNLEKMEKMGKSLNPKSSGSFKAVKCDVTKEDEVLSVFEVARKEYGALHICINNAGLAYDEPLLSGKTEKFRNMMEVNVIGLTVCTREAVKLMKETGVDDGHIVNLCSLAGHKVYPGSVHFYAATKYAVRALTIGIKNELRAMGSHIRISAISPGAVETEFASKAGGAEFANHVYSSMKCLKGEDIADSVIYVLSAPPHVGVHDIIVMPVEEGWSGVPTV